MIEILFGESEAASMKAAKNKIVIGTVKGPVSVWMAGKKAPPKKPFAGWVEGTSREVVCLEFMMDVGNIREPADSLYRKELLCSMYGQNQEEGLNDGLEEELGERLNEELEDGPEERLNEELGERLNEELEDGPEERLNEELGERLNEELEDGLEKELKDGLEEGLNEELREGVGKELNDRLGEELKKARNVHDKELLRLKRFLDSGETLRIWYSDAPYSRCGFYHLCQILKTCENEIRTVKLPEYTVWENRVVAYRNWGDIAAEEFAGFLPCEKKLSREEIHFYAMLWSRLAEENSPLRAVINGRVVSVPEDFYDFQIWARLTHKPVKEGRLIGDILGCFPMSVGDWWYANRIEYYIRQGKICVAEDSKNKYARMICLGKGGINNVG